jgi:hypothetical protein
MTADRMGSVDFTGRVALVSAASRDIGYAVAGRAAGWWRRGDDHRAQCAYSGGGSSWTSTQRTLRAASSSTARRGSVMSSTRGSARSNNGPKRGSAAKLRSAAVSPPRTYPRRGVGRGPQRDSRLTLPPPGETLLGLPACGGAAVHQPAAGTGRDDHAGAGYADAVSTEAYQQQPDRARHHEVVDQIRGGEPDSLRGGSR